MSRATAPRRWPDILIGVLVLLLLAGFAALLLGQRRTAGTVTPSTVTPSTATAPANSDVASAPGTAENAPSSQTTATTAITPPVTDSAAAPTNAAPRDAASPEAAPTNTTTETSTIPAAPADPVTAVPTTAAPSTTTDAATNVGATPEPQTPTPTTVTTTTTVIPRSGGAVATSASRVPLRSDYRVSLGSFDNETVARSRTAQVGSLGYTVYPIDVGSQVVAQIGPFADAASAQQALSDIQRAFPGALLYAPRARDASASNSAAAPPPANPTPANPVPTSTAPATPAPDSPVPAATSDAASGPVYIQVGAFAQIEGASKLVAQLRDLGYVPTVNAPEGRMVTVAVGPYTGEALTRTEKRLDDNDLDHFRVR